MRVVIMDSPSAPRLEPVMRPVAAEGGANMCRDADCRGEGESLGAAGGVVGVAGARCAGVLRVADARSVGGLLCVCKRENA